MSDYIAEMEELKNERDKLKRDILKFDNMFREMQVELMTYKDLYNDLLDKVLERVNND